MYPLIPVVVVADGRYFVLSLADSVWWPIFSRAVMMSLHEAVGVESSQCWSRSILHRAIPPCGDNTMISCSLLTGTSKATPSEYQSFIPASSSVSWWMVGVVIPVHKMCSWQESKAETSWRTKQHLKKLWADIVSIQKHTSYMYKGRKRGGCHVAETQLTYLDPCTWLYLYLDPLVLSGG